MNNALFEKIDQFVLEDVRTRVQNNEESTYPKELVEKMKSLGLFGMNIPEIYGGLGLSRVDISKVLARISEESVSLVSIFGSHFKVSSYLLNFGTEEQKKRLLPDIASGKIITASGYTEEVGKTIGSMKTEVVEDNGKWAISGSKSFVTNALHADLFAIVAKIKYMQKERFVTVLVKKDSLGLSIGADIPRLGLKSISVCEISLNQTPVDIETDILGGIDCDFSCVLNSMKVAELENYAVRAVGLGRGIVNELASYVRTKKSGDTFLVDIPVVKVKLEEMIQRQKSAEKLFEELVGSDPGEKETLLKAYEAKAQITEDTVALAMQSLKLHGGNGYMEKFPVSRFLRDAIGLTIIGMPTDIILSKIAEMKNKS